MKFRFLGLTSTLEVYFSQNVVDFLEMENFHSIHLNVWRNKVGPSKDIGLSFPCLQTQEFSTIHLTKRRKFSYQFFVS